MKKSTNFRIRLFFLLVLILGLGNQVQSQNYNVADTVSEFTKTTDFGTLHDYIHISNLDTFDFPMVWECEFDGKASCPLGWSISLNDPDSTYSPLNDGDSSGFMLSATDTLMNKLIIGIDHNGLIGSCFIGFEIYPLDNPLSTTNVGFDVTVVQGNSGLTDIIQMDQITDRNIFPNPTNGKVNFSSSVDRMELYDCNGKLVYSDNVFSLNSYVFDIPPGAYFLKLSNENSDPATSILIVK